MSESPSTPGSSLLARGVQADLLDPSDLPDGFWRPEEQVDGVARYTAERFFAKRPGDYATCVSLLAAGAGLLKIARLLHVHHQTVAAVRDRETAQIDIQKERVKRNIRLAVEIGAERLPDIMAELPAGQVPLATAMLVDKQAQLEGEPTHRIEVTHKGALTHEAVAAALNQFPDAIDVEATDVGTTHPPPGENGQKEAVPRALPDGASDRPPS